MKFYQFKKDVEAAFIKMMEEKQACVKYVGNLEVLPLFVRESIQLVEQKLNRFMGKEKCVYIGIAYSGRNEIIRTISSIKDTNEITEQSMLSSLSVPLNLDLIIRTGGEYRLSNFMLYQAAYAELFFSEKLCPEFSEKDLDDAFAWYATRKRRFGLL